ncbi:hypothetical protein TIFTF001_026243 [Ficus carica]|uniref:Uncharacterized protein n=1 Tax=Ficus carica TaxID=3494 RepID=A0AA88DKV3_FICCA|nr:hypothetical protein TIFTF001_026243 [Ficus carica]
MKEGIREGDYDGGGCDGHCKSGARARLEAKKGCDLSRRQKHVAGDEDGVGARLEQDSSGGESGTDFSAKSEKRSEPY